MKSEIGVVLRRLRRKYKYNQKKVANGIGVSQQSYSRYERGERTPARDVIDRICAFYELDPQEFFDRCDNVYLREASRYASAVAEEPGYGGEAVPEDLREYLAEVLQSGEDTAPRTLLEKSVIFNLRHCQNPDHRLLVFHFSRFMAGLGQTGMQDYDPDED